MHRLAVREISFSSFFPHTFDFTVIYARAVVSKFARKYVTGIFLDLTWRYVDDMQMSCDSFNIVNMAGNDSFTVAGDIDRVPYLHNLFRR